MIIVSVPLKDIVLDPSEKIDLSTLPEEEAISLLKRWYMEPFFHHSPT